MKDRRVGPFQVLNRLGNNRRQQVYRAMQVQQNREVALKFLTIPRDVQWDTVIDRIDREVAQLQQLRHRNLVQIYGAGFEDDEVFLAMELVAGESLDSVLARRGKLAPDQVVDYGRQICEALQFLHKRDLIHAKLTPGSIMVGPDGRITLVDFRLNRAKRRRWDAPVRRELELAAYMAPEQFTEGASGKSDFYSLGVILYEMLSGQLPYPPDTLGRMHKNKMNAPVPSVATHVMNCPIWLDQIISQMLAPDPSVRPHSALAISIAFDEIKKIDATKKAAVDQMTSGFNPLTVGQDKSEARKLLSRSKKRKPVNWSSVYQAGWFQATVSLSFLALATLIVWPILWPSQGQRIATATQLVSSDEAADWSEARVVLEPIMNSNSELSGQAGKVYFESLRKTMVRRAETGRIGQIDSDGEQAFARAFDLEATGRTEDALVMYTELVQSIDAAGDQRHVYCEAFDRQQLLTQQLAGPSDMEVFLAKIAGADDAATTEELLAAQSMLNDLVAQVSAQDQYRDVVVAAEARLEEIKQQLLALPATP